MKLGVWHKLPLLTMRNNLHEPDFYFMSPKSWQKTLSHLRPHFFCCQKLPFCFFVYITTQSWYIIFSLVVYFPITSSQPMRILLDSLSCCCCVNKRKMATSFLKAIGDKINICDTGPHWTYTQNLSQTNHFSWPKGVVYAISPILWCPHVWYLKKRL